MKKKVLLQIVIAISVVLVLFACSNSTSINSQEVALTKVMAQETMLDRENNRTATPRLTIDPTYIKTSAPRTTITNVPTLTSQEKMDVVTALEENNGGCEYPCWWGIIPGETNWQDAEKILGPIANSDLTFQLGNNQKGHTLEFIGENNDFSVRIIENKDKIVDVIRLNDNMPLAEFLQKYGKPDEIRISSDGLVPGPSIMRIALFYFDIGVMKGYLGESEIITHGGIEYLRNCANDFYESGPISLWNPKMKTTFEEVPMDNLVGGAPTSLQLVTIEDYSNYDVKSLCSAAINNPALACIETRADFWPNPNRLKTSEP